MPTFHDPLADAEEASTALRSLAHATRSFDDPAQTYRVFGELLAAVRSLGQVLDQLADAHLSHRGRAHDDNGEHPAGAHAALAAADELHRSRVLLDQAEVRLDAAFSYSGRIAWHPEPAEHDPVTSDASSLRWVGVVFLQGNDADQVIDLIEAEGTDAAIEHLRGYDYGEETTQAALENGYVYDQAPTGALDRTVTDEAGYTLTYSPFAGQVSLLRQYSVDPRDALEHPTMVAEPEAIAGIGNLRAETSGSRLRPSSAGEAEPPAAEAAATRAVAVGAGTPRTGSRHAPDASWFEHPGVAAVKQTRGLDR